MLCGDGVQMSHEMMIPFRQQTERKCIWDRRLLEKERGLEWAWFTMVQNATCIWALVAFSNGHGGSRFEKF
jgi:hypothetical protein